MKKRVLHLLGVFRPARHPEQHKADDEQHRDAAHAHVGTAGELAAHTDDHGTQEGCPLAADVEQAEVFAGFFRRDDLGKVAAAQCLHIVSDLMKKAGYDKVFVKKDLAGLDRIVCGVYY